MQPLVEAFLVIEQPKQRFSHWLKALAPLDDRAAPPFASVAAFYDPAADQALLALRYDELALGETRLRYVVELALLAEIGMIQPHELSEGDRKRFIGERLAKCTLRVNDQRSVVATLTELVRRVKELGLAPRTHVGKLPPRPALGAQPPGPARIVDSRPPEVPPLPHQRPAAPRTTTKPRPVDLPPLLVQAKSTRDLHQHSEELVEARRAAGPQPLPKIVETKRDNEPTAVRPSPNAVLARPEARTEDSIAAPSPTMIHARYLRGGRWVAVRIGALSLKGAALLSGALPRLDDRVDIALAFDTHRALVRGRVTKVSNADEVASSGAATFSVAFELDNTSRRQLTELLTAARTANITIKPPPARTARRFPVDWPVCLGTASGAVRAEALDVSLGGMFARPTHGLELDTTINFSVILDDSLMPVAGRARVARHIREVDARACGFMAGYGLQIVEMGDVDFDRWSQFVQRVERRAEKRVLVGASPARLAEIQAHLAAAGYAVTGGTDPGMLVQLAGTDGRPVDAAIIDAGWAPKNLPVEIESMFAARSVPCVTHSGDVKRARQAIDRLLSVAGSPTSRS